MKVFHAVVWTESAVRAPDPYLAFLQELVARKPLWGRRVTHLVLAPSLCTIGPGYPVFTRFSPPVVLGPATTIDDIRSADLQKYCLRSLTRGIERLAKDVPDVIFAGPLGILAPMSVAAQEVLQAVCQDSEGVEFLETAISNDAAYYGPSLAHIAAKFLVATGIDPTRAACIVCAGTVNSTIDRALAKSAELNNPALGSTTFNVGTIRIASSPTPPPALCDLGSMDPQEQATSLEILQVVQPVCMHPRAKVLLDRDALFERLARHLETGKHNVGHAIALHYARAGQRLPWNEKPVTPQSADFLDIFKNGEVYDHRSGAICFSAYEWNRLIRSKPEDELLRYFQDTLEEPWQRDRPNYRRILLTPTKVLLRGEDYYANLRNVSPVTRLNDLVDIVDIAMGLMKSELFDYQTPCDWKLSLAVADQIRNGALQLAWFDHKLPSIAAFRDLYREELSIAVSEFLEHVTFIYYAVLCARREKARTRVPSLVKSWRVLGDLARKVFGAIQDRVRNRQAGYMEAPLETRRLIRRWREADHPGENALVALLALEKHGHLIPAVGIGWGGIELPVAFRQIAALDNESGPHAYAVHFSHYSKGGERPETRPLSPGAEVADLVDKDVVVFDDNALSGRTLERVLEHLYVEHRIRPRAVYVTRLSGERRYDQMRMDEHGVVDPDLVSPSDSVEPFINGHLGETPFSRTWSRDVYENPIGVFSLARRRILELLFSNSSADRFDREGF